MDNIAELLANYIPENQYDEELDSWHELWDDGISIYQNYINIIKRFVILPWEDDLLPVVTSYILCSAKFSKVLPVMMCWGLQGSGKSELAKLANSLRGIKSSFSPNDTFASIRNELDSLKFFDPDEKSMKRDNTIMVWDNVYAATFVNDPKLYSTVLVGYKQETSIIRIAGKQGVNLEYDVFCPKILTTIEPLHCIASMGELHRRLLIIPHRQVTSMPKGEESEVDVASLLSSTNINWQGIEGKFQSFWWDKQACGDFARWRKFLSKEVGSKKGKIKLPDCIDSLRWEISVDIAATYMAAARCNNPQDVVDIFEAYWSRIDKVCGFISPLKEELEFFIQQSVGAQIELNAIAQANGKPPICKPTINPSDLKGYMEAAYAEGKLEDFPSIKRLSPVMAELGWKLSRKGWVQAF